MKHQPRSLCIAVLSVLISASGARAYSAQSIQLQTPRADDEARRREEVDRTPRPERIDRPDPVGVVVNVPRKDTESCLAQLIGQDPATDVAEIPLGEWIAAGAIEQIQWRTEFPNPRLRMDQRYELSYTARIEGRDLGWSANADHELMFVSGFRDAGGEWVIPPKSIRHIFEALPKGEFRDFRVVARDCVFLQPGEYLHWVAIYDPENGKRSVVEKRIRVPDFKSDSLTELNSRLPRVEYPKVEGTNRLAVSLMPGPLVLGVANKQPLSVEFIPVLSPSDQWPGRSDVIRWQNNRLVTVTSVLSQLRLATGDLSVAAVDVVNRSVVFEQTAFRELDWSSLDAQFNRFASDQVIALPALESLKQRSSFLREFLEKRLAAPSNGTTRVMILITGSVNFERGSDLSAVKTRGDCNCRIYHLRLRLNGGDGFDQIERLIRPLRPRTFDIDSPEDFREVLGKIVEDLDGL